MKHVFIILLTILSSVCFGQGELNALGNSYKKNSNILFENFLNQWSSEVKPIKTLDSLSEIKRYVYEIYQDFYNPFELERVGTGEFGADIYKGLKNVIIQNSIYFTIYKTDSLNFKWMDNTDKLVLKKDSIIDFRPNISFGESKILYLIPKYSLIINNFLGNEFYPLGTGGIMNPAKAKGSSEKKLAFLNKKLKIIYGHWGGYYHIETHPEVNQIFFNKDMTIAKVYYRLVYQGGEASYRKENKKWIFVKAQLTWIE